jgi:hypothetical protein
VPDGFKGKFQVQVEIDPEPFVKQDETWHVIE